MPMKYNEDTGIPYFVPDTAIELEEGVTPAPDVLRYGKRGVFAGDPPPKKFIPEFPGKPAPPSDSEFFAKLGHALVPPDGPITKPKAKGAVYLDPARKKIGDEPYGFVEPISPAGPPDSPVQKAYDDAFDFDKAAKQATPAALSATIATDAEIEEIERLCSERSVMHWPTLMRLINRLRMTEELLAAARRGR